MIKKYATLLNGNARVNNVLFFVVALLSGYTAALMTEASQHGIFSRELFEYAFRESFELVTVCAVAFAFLLIGLAFVFRRIAIPALVLNVLSCVLGIANKNKIIYRDMSVQPVDIFLAKDAMIAAADYEIVITKSFYLLLAASVVWFLLTLPIKTPIFSKTGTARRIVKRLAAMMLSLALAVGTIVSVFWREAALVSLGYSFSPKMIQMESINNTFYPAFFRAMSTLVTSPPQGYNAETMRELGEEIENYAERANGGMEADIIILQLESYFYPDNVDIEYDREEVFGGLLALGEEGASGWVVSPQTGGGTADVEFEVLTGFTSNDSQVLVNPFSMYVTEETPSIVGYLKERGYTAVSVHSYSTLLYNRVNAYKAFGFDESLFATDFDDPVMFGDYIGEASCIDKVIEEYDAIIERGEKAFLHVVTMQNHAPMPMGQYADDELVSATSDTLSDEDLKLAQIYLTSSRDIAAQVNRLAAHIEETGRDAILIIYGDHQTPIMKTDDDAGAGNLHAVPYAAEYEGDDGDEYFLLSHRTPLFVWSSFDYAGEKDLGTLAPNAALSTALRAFGVTRPAYFDYLLDSTDTFKSVTGGYVILEDGTLTTDISEAQSADNIERRLLQHDFLHGRRYLAQSVY